MEMRNGCDIPGVTGQGARKESASIVDEMGDDNFDDLLGKSGGRGRVRRENLRRSTAKIHPPGFS